MSQIKINLRNPIKLYGKQIKEKIFLISDYHKGLLPQRTPTHPEQHEGSQAVDADADQEDSGNREILPVDLADSIESYDKLNNRKKVEEVAVIISPDRRCAERQLVHFYSNAEQKNMVYLFV